MGSPKYIPIVGYDKSQTVETLNNMSNQADADRRFSRQEAREDRQFALQMARQKLLDKRYEDGIARQDRIEAEAKQKEADTLQGLIDASTMTVSPSTTEIVTENDKDIDFYSMSDDQKTKELNDYVSGLNAEISNDSLSDKNTQFLNEYNSAMKETDESLRSQKLLNLAKQRLGYKDIAKTSEAAENIKSILPYGNPAIAAYKYNKAAIGKIKDGVDYIKDAFTEKTDQDIIDEKSAKAKKLKKAQKQKTRTYNDAINQKMIEINKRKEEIAAKKKRNEEIKKLVSVEGLTEKGFLKKGKSAGKKYDVERTVNPETYRNKLEKSFAEKVKQISTSKKSTAYKAAFIKDLMDKKDKSKKAYNETLKSEKERIRKQLERAEKNEDEAKKIRLTARLKNIFEVEKEMRKRNSPEYIAKVKLDKAKAKNYDKKTENGK